MEGDKKHEHDCSCCSAAVTNPSVHQSLEEIDFERSVWQAAIDNNVEKLEKFAKASNFNPNVADNYGYTPLHYAARNGSLNAAKCLVRLGADVNAQTGNLRATPLHRAVSAKKVEMVRYLIQLGADINIKDADGLTPVDRATKDNQHQILCILCKNNSQESHES